MDVLPIEFRPEADQEATEAFDWYQQRNPDAAVRFRAELRRIVELIAAMPGAFPPYDGPVRKVTVQIPLPGLLPRTANQDRDPRRGSHHPPTRLLARSH